MIRYLVLFSIALLFASVAGAQAPDVYPILEGGIVKVGVQTAASQVDVADTASAGIVQLNSATGEKLLVCAPDAGPGQTVLFTDVTVENPGGGAAAQIKARAFSAAGCAGDLFSDSENSGFVRFAGPGSPIVVDVAAGDADITIP